MTHIHTLYAYDIIIKKKKNKITFKIELIKMHSIDSFNKCKIIYAGWFDSWSLLLIDACIHISHSINIQDMTFSFSSHSLARSLARLPALYTICYFNIWEKVLSKIFRNRTIKLCAKFNLALDYFFCLRCISFFFLLFLVHFLCLFVIEEWKVKDQCIKSISYYIDVCLCKIVLYVTQ